MVPEEFTMLLELPALMMVLPMVTVAVPPGGPRLKMSPGFGLELPLRVLLRIVIVALPKLPTLAIAPALELVEFPLIVLFSTVVVASPLLRPSFPMPPPAPPEELPLMVLLRIVSVALPEEPSLSMPPLAAAELPLTLQLLSVNVAWSL